MLLKLAELHFAKYGACADTCRRMNGGRDKVNGRGNGETSVTAEHSGVKTQRRVMGQVSAERVLAFGGHAPAAG